LDWIEKVEKEVSVRASNKRSDRGRGGIKHLAVFTCALTASSSHWRKSGKGSLGSSASSRPEAEYSFRRSATDFMAVDDERARLLLLLLQLLVAPGPGAPGMKASPSKGRRAPPDAAAVARERRDVTAAVASTMRAAHGHMQEETGPGDDDTGSVGAGGRRTRGLDKGGG